MEWLALIVGLVVSLVMMALAFALYFLPAIIATNRGRAVAPVWIVNFFFGWTLLGWVAALVWAVTERSAKEDAARAARERAELNRFKEA